jgi:acyl carrier protein
MNDGVYDLVALIQSRMDPPITVGPDTPLISSGAIDSFQIADLLALLEREYSVQLPLAAIGVDNFDTPRHMHRLISARRGGHGENA